MAKGFAPWQPRGQTRKYLAEVLEVIEAGRDDWPLSQRYWLYRLIALKGWTKYDEYKPSKYKKEKRHLCTPGKNLNNILDRGRRAGLIPWEAITSKRGLSESPYSRESPAQLARSLEYSISACQFDRQRDQPRKVVLWCETEGLFDSLCSVADHYGATMAAGKGFDTIGPKHKFARTVADLDDVLILHLGDLDKSGHTVHTALFADVAAFIEDLGGHVELRRIGLLEQHIQEYGLEHATTRSTPGLNAGNHGAGFTSRVECQLEAMDIKDIKALAASAFEEVLDMDLFNARLEYEKTARVEVAEMLIERLEA